MPRLPAVPLKGTFDSRTGIYTFGGHSYKPRWYANALRMSIQDCKTIIERGHKEDNTGLPQAILVVGKTRWEQIEKSYASWAGMTMFHYYAPDVNPGEVPSWLNVIKAHGTKLIHEVSAGIVYLLTYFEPNAIYRYFTDTAPPPVYTPPQPSPQPIPPGPVYSPPLVGSRYTLKGRIGDKDVDLTLEIE